MRVIHVADLHLGTELYGHMDSMTGMSTRMADFTRALDRVVDYAIAEDADLFLFAGDAYKTRDPSPTQQREFALRLRRLYEADIPIFLLTGNHDMPNAIARATSLDIFGALPLNKLVVASRPGVYTMETKSGPLQIVAIPWISRSVLLSKDDLKNKTVDEIDAELLLRLEGAIEHFVGTLREGVPAVMALHGSIAGAVFGSERSTLLGHDLLIPKSLIGNPRFDYVALGHIHKHQTVQRLPLAVYPGSIERVDFGEEADPKGFMIVDLKGFDTTARFVDLHARRFVTLSVDAYGEQPTEQVVEALREHTLSGSIVRLNVHLSMANEGAFQDRRVRAVLADAAYVTIARQVDRGERRRGGALAAALTPLEALGQWLEERETSAERTAILLDYGSRLIADLDARGA